MIKALIATAALVTATPVAAQEMFYFTPTTRLPSAKGAIEVCTATKEFAATTLEMIWDGHGHLTLLVLERSEPSEAVNIGYTVWINASMVKKPSTIAMQQVVKARFMQITYAACLRDYGPIY